MTGKKKREKEKAPCLARQRLNGKMGFRGTANAVNI
jgi:hypothetical protein